MTKIVQKCNEAGTIVVQVTVNKQGRVIDAQYSAKGLQILQVNV